MPFVIGSAELELQTPEEGTGIEGVYRATGPDLEVQGRLLADIGGYRAESLLTPRKPDLRNWLQGMGQPRVGDAFRFVQEASW
jgi:hypothetical protein